MAAKDGGTSGNKSGNPGGATSGATGDDNDAIQRLIDGDGSGPIDGANADNGNQSSGSERNSGHSERESSGSGNGSPSSERESSSSGIGNGDSSGTGDGNGKRTRNRSGNAGSGNASSGPDEKTRTAGDSVSRKQLKTPKQPKIDAEIPSSNKEIIGDLFQFGFWGVGQATGIPEWELDEDDARTIGDNAEKWLKSLGPKRAKNVVNALNKVGPSVAFFGSVGMALVPRIKLTFDRAKHGAIKPTQERKSSSGNPVDPPPANDTPASPSVGSDFAPGLHARPFTAQDFGEATSGFVGEVAGG